jgi:RNA polymerase sigma-70 factor (ECF subfamily)
LNAEAHQEERAQRLTRWLTSYRRLIYRVVTLYAPDPAAGEDLFQEIAIALWRSIPRYEGRSAESTWIYKVALNTAIAAARRGARPSAATEDPADQGQADPDWEHAAKLEWLYAKIRTMNLIDRSLVLLYLDGNSYEEIGEILGISVSSVGVKINRVKSRLKTLVDDGG